MAAGNIEYWKAKFDELEPDLLPPAASSHGLELHSQRPSEVWLVEARRRRAYLAPVAENFLVAYKESFNSFQRKLAQELIAARPGVIWHWEGIVRKAFERFIVSREDAHLDLALVATALYGKRTLSTDFNRLAYPIYQKMQEEALDAPALFKRGLRFVDHEAPDQGARAFFEHFSGTGPPVKS